MKDRPAANESHHHTKGTYERERWIEASMRGQLTYTELAVILGIDEAEALMLVGEKQKEWIETLSKNEPNSENHQTDKFR